MHDTRKIIAAASLLAIALAAPATAEDGQSVNVYNWYDYFGETTLQDFEAETGIRVVYDTFDSNEVLETKMLLGNSGYDVVFPASSFLSRQIPTGAYRKLDKSALENWGNLDPAFLEILAKADPGNAYAVPYTWGTTGIGYNATAVAERMPDAPLDSWEMIFDPEIVSRFADCGVFVLDSPVQVVSAALNYLGKDPNSEDRDDLAAAMAMLAEIRPYLRHFNNGQAINDLANGALCLAVIYNGDVSIAAMRAEEAGKPVDLAYTIPKEGAEVYFDVMAIPADAPHPENAHLFMDYILRPDVIAGVTNFVFFANANAASQEHIDEAVLSDPGIFPPPEVQAKLFPTVPHSAKFTRALTRAWTKFKSGR